MVNRSEGVPFKVVSDFEPAGDQPNAIQNLAAGIEKGEKFQTLLGSQVQGKAPLLLGRLRGFRGQHWLWRQINHSLRS